MFTSGCWGVRRQVYAELPGLFPTVGQFHPPPKLLAPAALSCSHFGHTGGCTGVLYYDFFIIFYTPPRAAKTSVLSKTHLSASPPTALTEASMDSGSAMPRASSAAAGRSCPGLGLCREWPRGTLRGSLGGCEDLGAPTAAPGRKSSRRAERNPFTFIEQQRQVDNTAALLGRGPGRSDQHTIRNITAQRWGPARASVPLVALEVVLARHLQVVEVEVGHHVPQGQHQPVQALVKVWTPGPSVLWPLPLRQRDSSEPRLPGRAPAQPPAPGPDTRSQAGGPHVLGSTYTSTV